MLLSYSFSVSLVVVAIYNNPVCKHKVEVHRSGNLCQDAFENDFAEGG